MTSTPWMKGVSVAVADPIPPVCPEDDRPSVKDLIQEHQEKVEKIREALQDHELFDNRKHDDLWLLRFWLSHKKTKEAIKAATHTLEFRNEHKLDDKDIRDVPPHKVNDGKVRAYLDCWGANAMVFTHPDPKRGVICFLTFQEMDQHKVVEVLDESYWLPIFMYCSEWSFQWLDYVTRTTGRLTKSVRFCDLHGLKMSEFSRECSKRDGHVMGLMEDCYPQLLQSLFMCYPPTFLNVIWKIARVIMPKRVRDKFDFLNPTDNPKDRRRLYTHISDEQLPSIFGGKNTVAPKDW